MRNHLFFARLVFLGNKYNRRYDMDKLEVIKRTLIKVMNESITETIQEEINDETFRIHINELTKDEIYKLLLTRVLQQLILTIYIMDHPESTNLDSMEIQKRAMIEVGKTLINISK